MENQDKTAQSDPLKQNPENYDDKSASLFNMPQPEEDKNPAGGPQFGFEKKDGWGTGFRGWLNKYGSSVVLPIIALLILAGGIYLYASQKSQEESIFLTEGEMTTDLEQETTGLNEELTGQKEVDQVGEETEKGAGEEIIEEIIPEGRKEQGVIIEKAVKGDGVTHLARRALKNYLKDHSQELTNEHKVYIEDYLKDRIGSQPLEIDEEITFSEDLIKEAIDASSQLTPEQLKVIEQFSALVVSW